MCVAGALMVHSDFGKEMAVRKYLVALFPVAAVLLTTFIIASKRSQDKPLPYLYEDTRQLVKLVEDAATEVENRGKDAFADFGVHGSRWFNDKYYLFIYEASGTCVFHPITPALVGRNLIDMKDYNGKPVIRNITDICRKPEQRASGWVFYLWEERTEFTPNWKISYIRKAVAPDGSIYAVGCGLYNFKIEKVFVKERVDQAAALLEAEGEEAAFAEFTNPAGPYQFLGTYIFVMDSHGQTLVDPAFPTIGNRDLSNFRDAVGHYVVKEILEKLEKSDSAWVQYLRPKTGAILPSRKVVYVRKVCARGKTFYVGADFFMATPVWMRL